MSDSTKDSNVVREDLYFTLYAEPDSTLSEYTILDNVHRMTQMQRDPVGRTVQALHNYHGVMPKYGGTVANKYLQSAGNDKSTKSLLLQSKADMTKIMNDMNDEANLLTGANMSTKFLRIFVTEAQVIHPDITTKLQEDIEKFPYFRDISEQVGSQFVILADWNQIDPLFTLDCENLPNENLQTAGRMSRLLFYKMFITIYGMMEDAEKFLNCLFMRAMPYEENHAFFHPNYAKESAAAHGNNYAHDVFHTNRAIDALMEIWSELIKKYGDQLRLVNLIYPITFLVKMKDEIFEINVEDSVQTVDRLNRPVEKINRTNDALKAEEKRFIEDNDSASTL